MTLPGGTLTNLRYGIVHDVQAARIGVLELDRIEVRGMERGRGDSIGDCRCPSLHSMND
jgi:hypothetical protein